MSPPLLVVGVAVISSCGHAQVPTGDHLQFQSINRQEVYPQSPATGSLSSSQPTQSFSSNINNNQPEQQFPSQLFNNGNQQEQLQPATSQNTGHIIPQFPGVNPIQNTATPAVHLDTQRFQQIVSGSERFALELFSVSNEMIYPLKMIPCSSYSIPHLQRTVDELQSVKYNFILSPFSIWSLLVLIAEGARGNTFNQLQRVLGIGLAEDFYYTREVYRQFQLALS